MRNLSLIITFAALAGIGCSHAEKKSETVADAKAAVAAPVEKTKAEATKATTGSGTKVECSVKGDSRTLEVRTKDKGCELAYVKAGKEGIVASAAHGSEYCDKAFE